jgi:hypothetical protein
MGTACASHDARLRPWVEAAQRTARRNVSLFTPANRFQLFLRSAVLRDCHITCEAARVAAV